MIERLRIERTDMNLEEFACACGIPPRTYYRWISGQTEARPTPRQTKAICKVLRISIKNLPDDFGPVHVKESFK